MLKLHRSFGHPSASALYKLLRRAHPDEANQSTRQTLEQIAKECETCLRHASKPRRFKLTVGHNNARFNHVVAVDIMYINNKPILHVVDEATHFSSAQWLRKVSSSEVWKALLRCWCNVYLGPPDHLRIDQGSQFTSDEFKSLSESAGISILEAPVESPNSMSHVERYHGPCLLYTSDAADE